MEFEIADISYKPAEFYLEVVPDRSSETLLPIVAKVYERKTEVHSDEWAMYRRLFNDTGLLHKTVIHSLYFVDPTTGVHTRNIESYWGK